MWDDISPFGNPGGLAMHGKVRNWARLVKGNPKFDKDAPPDVEFSRIEMDLIARAAGSVAGIDSPWPDNGRTGASRPSGGPEHPQERDGIPATISGAYTPGAV